MVILLKRFMLYQKTTQDGITLDKMARYEQNPQ